VRVLTVAERAPTAFRGVVGAFPGRVVEEGAESDEMLVIQVLLLSTQRHQAARYLHFTGSRFPPALCRNSARLLLAA
jgi:hypothetical protein